MHLSPSYHRVFVSHILVGVHFNVLFDFLTDIFIIGYGRFDHIPARVAVVFPNIRFLIVLDADDIPKQKDLTVHETIRSADDG